MKSLAPKNLMPFGRTSLFPVFLVLLMPYVVQKEGCNKDSAPDCTELSAPLAGSSVSATNLTLSWDAADGEPTGYKVTIGTSPGDNDISDEVNVGDVTSFQPGGIPSGSTIHVTIIPFNTNGDASGCDEISFSTLPGLSPPFCTQLSSPTAGSTVSSTNVTLTWPAASGNPDGYRVSIGTSSGGSQIVNNLDVGNVTSLSPSNLPSNSSIFVRINPYNAAGDASGCQELSFTIPSTTTPPVQLHVRRNIHDLWQQNPNHPIIETYKQGITAMRALPSNHPHSWDTQANIHNLHCDHATWYFLPWHRAYLLYFEEAIRAVTGDNSFALPYWDWTDPMRIPDVFYTGSLAHTRNRSLGSTFDQFTFNTDMLDDIMDLQGFQAFASFENGGFGELEGSPHNNIHVWVGDDMGRVADAGNDPLFWCHHANVDRIWALWNEMGNVNSDDTDWLNHMFNDHFFDGSGSSIDVSVSDMVSTYNLGNLSYRYDDQSATAPPTAIGDLPRIYKKIAGLEFAVGPMMSAGVNAVVTQTVTPSAAFFTKLDEILDQPEDEFLEEMVYLEIKGVMPPENDNILVGVFLNSDNLTVNTSPDDRHFVGTFSFFLHGGTNGTDDHDHSNLNYYFDITPTLRNLKGTSTFPTSTIKVQLIALPVTGSGSTATFMPGEFIISAVNRVIE